MAVTSVRDCSRGPEVGTVGREVSPNVSTHDVCPGSRRGRVVVVVGDFGVVSDTSAFLDALLLHALTTSTAKPSNITSARRSPGSRSIIPAPKARRTRLPPW